MNKQSEYKENVKLYFPIEFIEFLKSKNALKLFYDNTVDSLRRTTDNKVTPEDIADNFVSVLGIKSSRHRYFMRAFVWAKTKEGHSFWRELDVEWYKINN